MMDGLYDSSCLLLSRRMWGTYLLLWLSLGGPLLLSPLLAQRTCGSPAYMERLLDAHPEMRRNLHQIDQAAMRRTKGVSGTIVIPVVVHVVYHRAAENISDAQVLSQLQVLNQDFQRQNVDRSQTDPRWQAVVGNPRIRFELAKRDPSGQPTTGITRTRSSRAIFYAGDNQVKYRSMGGVDAWDPLHYLNIWVCPLGMGVLGYAQFPGGPRETDGVVISYRHFGTTGTVSPPFDQGRTTTHEVGHWLNLRHIWGDGGCEADDQVADTPPADRPHHGCTRYEESCGGPNMVQNFMDYTDDACMNLFTQGQAQRMRALFSPGGFRAELLNSEALQAPTPPVATLSAPLDVEVYEVGDSFARLRWTASSSAEGYRVRLRPLGGDWIERSFSRPYVNPSQLRRCTDYECRIATVQGSQMSEFSPTVYFSTQGCAASFSVREAPVALGAAFENTGVARLHWDSLPGAKLYHVQFKALGSKRIIEQRPEEATTRVGGLRADRQYMFRVRAMFAGGTPSPFSDIHQFGGRTLAQQTYRSDQASRGTGLGRYEAEQQRLLLTLPLESATLFTPRLLDANGTVIQTFAASWIQPHQGFSLSVPRLANGTYVLELLDEDGFVFREAIQVP